MKRKDTYMPHVHTKPNQHDMTVSGYIVRVDQPDPLCLVHMHKKMGKLMQIGGHIELDQTPWQAINDEVEQESGYRFSELHVVQPSNNRVDIEGSVVHPVPFTMNTHNVGNEHYHSDLCYGFIAHDVPQHSVASGESLDLRWMTLAELDNAVTAGKALADTVEIYRWLIANVGSYALVAATKFSLEKPYSPVATYTVGAPGE